MGIRRGRIHRRYVCWQGWQSREKIQAKHVYLKKEGSWGPQHVLVAKGLDELIGTRGDLEDR